MVTVRVDADLCVGHGRCYVLAPDVFGADEFGHCIVLEEQRDGRARVAGADGRRQLSGTSDNHRAVATGGSDAGRAGIRRQAGDRQRRGIGHGRGHGRAARRAGRRGARDRHQEARRLRASPASPRPTCANPTQIDDAVAKIGKVVDSLFNCAGLPNTFSNLDVMLVNFCGLRHLTERVIPNIVEGWRDREHRVVGRHRLADEHGDARHAARDARLRRGGEGVVRSRSRAHRQRLRAVEGGDQRVHRGAVVHAGAAGDPHQLPQPRARPTRR